MFCNSLDIFNVYTIVVYKLGWVREMEDYQMMISPEQLKKYEENDHAMKAKDLFSELAKCNKRVTQFEYCCLRDHLFTVIHFGNGHRSGVTSNLLIKEI